MLVRVTFWAALVVPTVCAVNVSDAGAKESGGAAVPFASRICWPIEAVSLRTTAPLMLPLAPKAGEKVTLSVQLLPALRMRLAAHGLVPLPVAAKSPLDAIELRVSALALTFLTVTVLPVLAVPTACVANARLAGVKVRGAIFPPDPVPDSVTSCGLKDVPSVIVIAPLTAAAAVGVKVTAMLHLAFEASAEPQVVPLELMA